MDDDVPKHQRGPPPAEASKAETRLKGHLGHLTNDEEVSFQEFKKLCIKERLYKPATVDSKASHDEGTLMYVVGHLLSRTPLISMPPAGTYELENLSLKMPLSNSRTQRYGARRMTSTRYTRR